MNFTETERQILDLATGSVEDLLQWSGSVIDDVDIIGRLARAFHRGRKPEPSVVARFLGEGYPGLSPVYHMYMLQRKLIMEILRFKSQRREEGYVAPHAMTELDPFLAGRENLPPTTIVASKRALASRLSMLWGEVHRPSCPWAAFEAGTVDTQYETFAFDYFDFTEAEERDMFANRDQLRLLGASLAHRCRERQQPEAHRALHRSLLRKVQILRQFNVITEENCLQYYQLKPTCGSWIRVPGSFLLISFDLFCRFKEDQRRALAGDIPGCTTWIPLSAGELSWIPPSFQEWMRSVVEVMC